MARFFQPWRADPCLPSTFQFYRKNFTLLSHGYTETVDVHVDKVRRGRTSKSLWRWMKRRAAVEPSIGHLNPDSAFRNLNCDK